MTILQEQVIQWAKNTLAMLETIQDPERFVRKCKHCEETIYDFIGRHSNKRLLRHPCGGCRPSGQWIIKEELISAPASG